jgi:alcohol dehydrogenase
MENYFEFYSPVKLLSGEKALTHVPYELSVLQAERPMVVTDEGVEQSGLIKQFLKCSGESEMRLAGVYNNVPIDSSVETVQDVARQYQENQCDSLIGVGGGSVINTVKAANILITENSSDLLAFEGAGVLEHTLKPMVMVPTTAGTGSEATAVAVITDRKHHRKRTFTSPFLMPHLAVIDPEMTVTLPPLMTAATGMDALAHAIEAYTCLGKNPLSDAYAFAAVKAVSENLHRVTRYPKDREGRLAMATAATMAGIAFSNSMVGMVHALGHGVNSVCRVPHGVAMSILLPYVLAYNVRKGEPELVNAVAELLLPLAGPQEYASTTESKRSKQVVSVIHELQQALYQLSGLPRTLRETGKVSLEDLKEIALVAMGDSTLVYNPVEITSADALDVLQHAYE